MTTSAITTNPAAALAAQSEAAAAQRQRDENRKPAIEPPRDSGQASRYAEREREASRAEGRGSKVDKDA